MKKRSLKSSGLSKLRGRKRKKISASGESLIKTSLLRPGQTLPLVVQPAVEGIDLSSWAANNRDWINARLLTHGGLLFRNFNIASAMAFEEVIASASGELLEYRERSSPRSHVSGNVYTSTDYPADQRIFLHNENSYANTWPLKIFFFCHTPPGGGGETPLADVRKVMARLSPKTIESFKEKGIMYVRNLSDELGLSWQTVFQTTDKAEVEARAASSKNGYALEWKADGGLRTRRVAPAIVQHPQTGESLWFNHATFFHISTMEPATRDALLALYNEIDLPNNTYYGDGSPIEPETLDELRAAYESETIAFPWQKGDLLMLDNMMIAHSRSPYTGQRKILTGMSEPFGISG